LFKEQDTLLGGVRKFWTDVLGTLVHDASAQRRLLPSYAALDLTCRTVVSTLASAVRFRLTHDQMRLGDIARDGVRSDDYEENDNNTSSFVP
jgi:hypothetical protein